MKRKNLMMSFLFVLSTIGMVSCVGGSKQTPEPNSNDSIIEVQEEVIQLPSFDYTPVAPVNGKLKGVVELGASGFNSFIIELDKEKNWQIKKKEFGNSMVTEKLTTAKEVKSTLRDYIKTIVDFGVKSRDVHFVVSSGAAKEDITATIISALKEIGYVVNVVTPNQEAKYAFTCVSPNDFKNKSFVVDLGSGNTKVSYVKDEKIATRETYGAKYYQKDVDDNSVYNDVKEKLSDIPADNTKTCFLIGGVPYQMAKFLKKGDERYTVLDINLNTYDELAKEEGEKFKAGLNIYKGILDATNCKQIVFDWDANFTIGFLLSIPY